MARDFSVEVMQLLDDYEQEVRDTVQKDIEKVAKETAKELRNTSPKAPGGGEYAKSWTATKRGNGFVVHNKKHYRLTHLLENGHVIRNQYGTYGRTDPQKHIEPAEQQAAEKLVREIEEDLNR